jgi:hypothetical protein
MKPPPCSPTGPYGERYPFIGHFAYLSKKLIQIPQIKKALTKKRPSMYP